MDKIKILLLLLVAVLLFALFYQKSNYSEKETTSNLMVYKNPDYNYSLSYSEGVKVEQIGSPKSTDCIKISYGLAYLALQSSKANPGGCTQTGMGAYSKRTPVKTSLMIEGKAVDFTGDYVDNSQDQYAEGDNEFFRNEGLLGKESVIELGGYFKKSEKAQYQKDLEVVKNVLSTLNKI